MPESTVYEIDDETRDALRVMRNLATTLGLDIEAAEWRCIEIVTKRFGLADGESVAYPIERFRTEN